MLKVLEMILKQKLREQKKLWSSLREIWYFEKYTENMTKSICLSWTNLCKSAPPPLFPCYKDVPVCLLTLPCVYCSLMMMLWYPHSLLLKKTKTKEQKQKKTKIFLVCLFHSFPVNICKTIQPLLCLDLFILDLPCRWLCLSPTMEKP